MDKKLPPVHADTMLRLGVSKTWGSLLALGGLIGVADA